MKVFYLFILLFISPSLFSQDFNGQWRGSFNSSSYGFAGMADNSIDYVLELQIAGAEVTGYSYTYFNEGGKRYYTICKLTGTCNRSTKEIVVTETERVKYNTPPDFLNCFQTHRLRYERDTGDVESLRGTWVPAPNQSGGCGYGSTLLSRKIVRVYASVLKSADKKENKPLVKKATKPTLTKPKTVIAKKIPPKKKPSNPVVKTLPKTKPPVKPDTNKQDVVKKEDDKKYAPAIIPNVKKADTIAQKVKGFEIRRKDIIRTIAITQPTFRVDFYDNGEIDGDSITVFYNNKIILSHKMLTANAISLTLSLDDNVKENIITMYADNLGSIPPNTALMIVTDGDKRYEVRIESDTQKSGSVIFVHGK